MNDKKNEPSLEDLGLDAPPPKKTMIQRLQEESEFERSEAGREIRSGQEAAAVSGQMICSQCGYVGSPKKFTRSDAGTELTIWVVCIIGGLFFPPLFLVAFVFSVFRFASKYRGCPSCRSRHMVPAGSHGGKSSLASRHVG